MLTYTQAKGFSKRGIEQGSTDLLFTNIPSYIRLLISHRHGKGEDQYGNTKRYS